MKQPYRAVESLRRLLQESFVAGQACRDAFAHGYAAGGVHGSWQSWVAMGAAKSA